MSGQELSVTITDGGFEFSFIIDQDDMEADLARVAKTWARYRTSGKTMDEIWSMYKASKP